MSKLIIANWKSHKNTARVQEWWQEFQSSTLGVNWSETEVIIAPPFSLLPKLAEVIQASNEPVALAVQDLSPFPPGSYTGAVSAENVTEFGVAYAIVGHSERRRYFHETHADVANKVERALEAKITPILCVDRDYAEAQAAALNPEFVSQCIVAYEPLEAIGSGNNQPASEVEPIVAQLKTLFAGSPIIYGGSVSAGNVAEYTAVCDGVLVGTKALKAQDFTALIAAAI
jgi:triosephosphate isomerase